MVMLRGKYVCKNIRLFDIWIAYTLIKSGQFSKSFKTSRKLTAPHDGASVHACAITITNDSASVHAGAA